MSQKRFIVEMDESLAAILKNSGQIKIIESELCETLPDGWDLGGSWITERGEIIPVDHAADLHHSHIALDHFGNDDMLNDEGEYDKYSHDMAQEHAYNDGWVRISTRGSRTFSVDWQATVSSAAIRALYALIKNDPNTYQNYEVEAEGDFETFDNVGDFVRYLRRVLS